MAGYLRIVVSVAVVFASACSSLATQGVGHPDAALGAQLYESCASCHGADGLGRADGAVPRIAGQRYSALLRELTAFGNGRRWDDKLPGGAGIHALADPLAVPALAAYLADLGSGGQRGIGSGILFRFGAESYAQHCTDCHGADGYGRDDAVPTIAGQHYRYLLRVLYETADGRRGDMPGRHRRLLKRLDYDEIQGLADYLSRMEWRTPSSP